MKVFFINTVFGTGSTGQIVLGLQDYLQNKGEEVFVAYGRGQMSAEHNTMKIETKVGNYVHALMTRITDKTAFYSKKATGRLLHLLDDFNPDVIHIHNLHGYYLDIQMLFEYVKMKDIPTVCTLHDCWMFTGHCSHFTSAACDKWIEGCYSCPQKKEYPASYVMDNSSSNYIKKKECFTNVPHMRLITPSNWLKDLVKQSFLAEYPCEVIYNGLETDLYKPNLDNDVREKYQLGNKKIVLGVANVWTVTKGYDDFLELSDLLDDTYQIIMVGLSEKQIKNLPRNIIGIERTNNKKELIDLYSAADVYFNASVQETMGLTTAESTMCGTPVIVYNATAIPESVSKQNGVIVEPHDLHRVVDAIHMLEINKQTYYQQCIVYGKRFRKEFSDEKYYSVYKDMINESIVLNQCTSSI